MIPQTQIPIMVGPVGVFFNLPGITALNMNACTLTKVFQGTINRWNDPIIQAQNPGVALPNQLITVFTRKSGSSSTFGACAGRSLRFAATRPWRATGIHHPASL